MQVSDRIGIHRQGHDCRPNVLWFLQLNRLFDLNLRRPVGGADQAGIGRPGNGDSGLPLAAGDEPPGLFDDTAVASPG
jgi:hypothetical protein